MSSIQNLERRAEVRRCFVKGSFTNYPDNSGLSEVSFLTFLNNCLHCFWFWRFAVLFLYFVFLTTLTLFFKHILQTPDVNYLITPSGHCNFCHLFLCSMMLIFQLDLTVSCPPNIISLINRLVAVDPDKFYKNYSYSLFFLPPLCSLCWFSIRNSVLNFLLLQFKWTFVSP